MKKCILAFALVLILIFGNSISVFGAVDQDVTIVNPVSGSSLTSTNLLISVKMTLPKNIKVSVSEVRKSTGETSVALGESDMKAIMDGTYASTSSLVYSSIVAGESFSSTNKLTFYTKKIDPINPGVYLIKVDTMSQDKVVYSSRNYVTIKKAAEADSKLFDSSQSGTGAFLQGLIKSIFGN